PNDTEALRWFHSAAEQGNAVGQLKVGLFYERGQGVPKDFAEAAKWYRKAAEQGNTDAQILLGRCYEIGQGVPQDYMQAHMWFNLGVASSSSGDFRDLGLTSRDNVAAKMLPAQIAEAQRLAREWKPGKAK